MKNTSDMSEKLKIKEIKDVVIKFSGDSGDGMQLSGTLLANLSALLGNEIATFPDFPAEIRAPQGTLSGVSGFQLQIGTKVYNSGGRMDVLIAMNPAALKVNAQLLKKGSIIIVDEDSFQKKDLEKAGFKTNNPFQELDITSFEILSIPITTLTKDSLGNLDLDNKSKLRCKNMFALGLTCWLFNFPVDRIYPLLTNKFSKSPIIMDANLEVLLAGFNYGNNNHLSVSTYRIDSIKKEAGFYMDINGNTATAYGLIAAAEKAKLQLFLGSYPITPATDILHELSKRRDLGVKAIQMEDEIAGISTAIGAAFAGSLAATSTSGPGMALKSEAINLAVMAELPLVIIDVQRGGPSTGLPTKTEQTDLRQALYGRNGESPLVVIAAISPTNCFDSAYWAAKLALEHITPVILLTDSYIANGASSWRIPSEDEYLPISVHDFKQCKSDLWNGALRNEDTMVRYWAPAGTPGYAHRIGGLEKDYNTGAISTDSSNHQKMVDVRRAKIKNIANCIPPLKVIGNPKSHTLVIGWGGTYGHIREAIDMMLDQETVVAFAHFQFICPFPQNTESVIRKFEQIIVVEQNEGQLAGYLAEQFSGLNIIKYNEVNGQPFQVPNLVEFITNICNLKSK